jgi:hypothetical protein
VELPYGCWAGDTPASADTSPREEQAAERCASACCPPLLRYHSAELNSPCLPLPKPGRELVPKLTRWRRAVAPMRRATFSTCSAAPHSTPRPVPVPRPSPSKVAEAAHRLQQPRGWSGAYLLRAAAAFPEHEARVQLGFPAAPPPFSSAPPFRQKPFRRGLAQPSACVTHSPGVGADTLPRLWAMTHPAPLRHLTHAGFGGLSAVRRAEPTQLHRTRCVLFPCVGAREPHPRVAPPPR